MEFPEAALIAIAVAGSFDCGSAPLREADTSLRMTGCGEVQGSADYNIGEFAGHYDHFHNLLAGDCGFDLFFRQGALLDYFSR